MLWKTGRGDRRFYTKDCRRIMNFFEVVGCVALISEISTFYGEIWTQLSRKVNSGCLRTATGSSFHILANFIDVRVFYRENGILIDHYSFIVHRHSPPSRRRGTRRVLLFSIRRIIFNITRNRWSFLSFDYIPYAPKHHVSLFFFFFFLNIVTRTLNLKRFHLLDRRFLPRSFLSA